MMAKRKLQEALVCVILSVRESDSAPASRGLEPSIEPFGTR
jgi:hypothetical protein